MAIAKLEPVEHLKEYELYTLKDREAELLETGPDTEVGDMTTAIQDTHDRVQNKRMQYLAYTIYQSWPDQESGIFPLEKYNQMGRELGEKFAPGHLVWVTTHTDKKNTHNHITICSVHSETGKALALKKADIRRLHEINNGIARENGLSLNLPRVKDPTLNLPDHVRQMFAQGKPHWMIHMVEKIDFARAISTNFDEFKSHLHFLGVGTVIEDKNITYSYGGDEKRKKRGKGLGTLFDKDGLMKAFKENDEKFAKYPGLREQLRSDVRAAFDGKGNPLGTPSDLLLESKSHPRLGDKDYSKFTKIARRDNHRELPAIFDERGGVLHGEMKKALGVSILEYCAQNKIKTSLNQKGETVLHGRDFVLLKDFEWINTKNRTKGNIIDFVGLHERTGFLGAIAKINNNPRLLLLEQVAGESKRGYQSFHIPRPERASAQAGSQMLHKFLKARGIHGDAAKTLLESKSVHVGKDMSIWLMGDNGDSAIEFREEPNGKWKSKRHGNPSGVFLETHTKSKHAVVYRDPFEFALFKAKGGLPGHRDANVLVQLGDDGSDQRLDELLALHEHITHVHLAHSMARDGQEQHQQRAQSLTKRFNPFDIQIKELKLSDLGKDRSHGPDIGF